MEIRLSSYHGHKPFLSLIYDLVYVYDKHTFTYTAGAGHWFSIKVGLYEYEYEEIVKKYSKYFDKRK